MSEKADTSMKVGQRSRSAALRIASMSSARGHLELGNLKVPIAIGQTGISPRKLEGDGATPLGNFRVIEILYRADRLCRPQAGLPVIPIRKADGWCDEPWDRNYNRAVSLPYPASAERIWRNDALYDLIVVLDYNVRCRSKGRGSAIFIHVARRNFAPTAGCIALRKPDLVRLVKHLTRRSRIDIRSVNRPTHRGRRGLR